MLAAAQLDLRFGMALLGQQLLQVQFAVAQAVLVLYQFDSQFPVIHSFELRVLLGALELQQLVLLGGTRLFFQMLDLLVDFFAQVAETV